MNQQLSRWLLLSAIAGMMMVTLMACGERTRSDVQSNRAPTTQAAQTRIALTNAPATSGPSPTPTTTSTPYMTATPFPDADPEAIVATIGDEEITLDAFQQRVRFERWLPLVGLDRRIERSGADIVLDLTRAENAQTVALLQTINGDPQSFGRQVLDIITIEQIALQEAAARDMEVIQTAYDARIALRIGVTLNSDGSRPANWDSAYDTFMEEMTLYTGMSESDFLEIIRALTFYDQVGDIIREQAPLDGVEAGLVNFNVQDLVVATQEEAFEIVDLLADGASLATLATRFDVVGTTGDTTRRVTPGTTELPPDVVNIIFESNVNDVIGPIAIPDGWYVAVVISEDLNIPDPEDIEQIQNDYYVQWINDRVNDPEITVINDLWRDFVPGDPLPRDVSEFMRDENFIVPTAPYADRDITPTPIPLSEVQG